MRRVEGVHASYVGRADPSGAVLGDRCLILSDEGSNMHVRWITGSMEGEYGQVRPRDLVADAMVHDAADEFGFEAGRGSQRVAINVEGVYEAGGTVALFEALESEGHLATLRDAAREAVKTIRGRLLVDDEWHAVREALGSVADEVETSAIIAAIESVSGDLEGDE